MNESSIRARRDFGIVRQYVKFCVVGGSGVVVDMAVLYALASPGWLGWGLTLSKVIAAEVAMFNNFLWNDGWTFREVAAERQSVGEADAIPGGTSSTSPHPEKELEKKAGLVELGPPKLARWRAWLARLVKFNVICTVGIALSVVLLTALVRGLGMNVYLANFISIVAVSVWNFALNRRFGWNARVEAARIPTGT